MKARQFLFITSFLVFIILPHNSYAQLHRNCGTMSHLRYQEVKHPFLKKRIEAQNIAIAKWNKSRSKASDDTIIHIPIVFHIIWTTAIQNISAAQIFSQLFVLNQDFRHNNADSINTPSQFQALMADVGVEFCLAHQDPNGNWTDGITRTHSTKSVFDMNTDDAKFSAQGGYDAWDATKYLNIWIVPAITNNGSSDILGYTQMPGGNWSTDGIVIGYKYIGTMGTAHSPFNKGRTATHETGHWLGLYHIWGDDNGACWGSDYVDDTPNQAAYNYDCPTDPHISCSNNGDMFMNYMDYTDDSCMNMFSLGQKARMRAVLNTTRVAIKTSGRCMANAIIPASKEFNFQVYPNPSNQSINISNYPIHLRSFKVRIINMEGKQVYQSTYPANRQSINISIKELKSGLYLIQLSDDQNFGFNKLIIQH